MAAHHMYLVTADQVAVDALARALQSEGFSVDIQDPGADVPAEPSVDLTVVLLNNPTALAEVETCRDLRGRTDGYIMLVTEQRSETERIAALDTGIDDYVSMPVSRAAMRSVSLRCSVNSMMYPSVSPRRSRQASTSASAVGLWSNTAVRSTPGSAGTSVPGS